MVGGGGSNRRFDGLPLAAVGARIDATGGRQSAARKRDSQS